MPCLKLCQWSNANFQYICVEYPPKFINVKGERATRLFVLFYHTKCTRSRQITIWGEWLCTSFFHEIHWYVICSSLSDASEHAKFYLYHGIRIKQSRHHANFLCKKLINTNTLRFNFYAVIVIKMWDRRNFFRQSILNLPTFNYWRQQYSCKGIMAALYDCWRECWLLSRALIFTIITTELICEACHFNISALLPCFEAVASFYINKIRLRLVKLLIKKYVIY